MFEDTNKLPGTELKLRPESESTGEPNLEDGDQAFNVYEGVFRYNQNCRYRLTKRDKVRIRNLKNYYHRRWEYDKTESNGPPRFRDATNRKLVKTFVARYGETTVRGLLHAIIVYNDIALVSAVDGISLKRLRRAPLHQILNFVFFGPFMAIVRLSKDQFSVRITEGMGRAGGGGSWSARKVNDQFEVIRYNGRICF